MSDASGTLSSQKEVTLKISMGVTEAIITWANKFVEVAKKTPNFPQEKSSGYCVVKCLEGRTLLVFQVGEVPYEKIEKYLRLANEKADRLAALTGLGHKGSWQSRDGLEKWGGAILAGEYIFSFSGLPELADEAVMLWTAMHCGVLPYSGAVEIASVSGNGVFRAIGAAMEQK